MGIFVGGIILPTPKVLHGGFIFLECSLFEFPFLKHNFYTVKKSKQPCREASIEKNQGLWPTPLSELPASSQQQLPAM